MTILVITRRQTCPQLPRTPLENIYHVVPGSKPYRNEVFYSPLEAVLFREEDIKPI